MSGTEISMSMTYLDGPTYPGEDENYTRAFDPDAEEENFDRIKRENRQINRRSAEIFFYVHIGLFAMCGCSLRIATDILFGNFLKIQDTTQVVNQSFVSNMIGCFVLGSLEGSALGRTRLAALYKGLAVGFCGSYTSWSAWNQQLSLTLIGEAQTSSQSQVLSIFSWFIGFYVFFASYGVGRDFGKATGKKIGSRVVRKGRMIADVTATIIFIVAFACFILLLLLDVTRKVKVVCLSLLLAPFGACMRNWLSRFQIDKFRMPLGTFVANFAGSILVAIAHVLVARVYSADECDEDDVCWPITALSAVTVGFCGSLTTVSTVVSEIFDIKKEFPAHAYGYAIFTAVTCQLITGIINGVNYSFN